MKFSKLFILIIILAVSAQANPRSHRHHSRPTRHYNYSRHHYGYNNYYRTYGYYRYYTPVVRTTKSTTIYPENLVVISADSVAEDIIALNSLMSRGVISEKDFMRAKKTLLNRIGMAINPAALEVSTVEIIEQIETLYQMRSSDLITNREFLKQKNKLLAMI